jgi:hypothetical protein
MPVWRCPHCNTPQAETSRCWVCRRSTTSCVTCRHFRKGVAGGLGLCGLDRRHVALTGAEVRPCWVSAPQPVDPGRHWAGSTRVRAPGDAIGHTVAITAATTAAIDGVAVAGTPPARRPRTFVPIDEPEGDAPERTAGAAGAAEAARAPGPVSRVPGTWWLWGDPEPWPES